jgi:hypothetical protein
MTYQVYFKITTKGGAEKEVGPISLDVIDPYFEAPSSVIDQCTHQDKWNRNKTVVEKCKKKCIFDCLLDVDCSFPSIPPYIIGQEVSCRNGYYKVKFCGKDQNSSQCVYKC